MTAQFKVQIWIHALTPSGPRFLLLKTQPARGAFWQPVTGGVEEGEDVESAALREAIEETGFHFRSGPEAIGVPFEFEKHGRKFQEHAFLIEAVADGAVLPSPRLDPHEHQEFRWVDAATAAEMTHYESNREVLKQVFSRLKIKGD